jgi:pyruvate-formate lyase-activating enzyme
LPDSPTILEFDKPQFKVKLYPDVLALQVKEAAIGDFDKLAEATPHLADTLRWLVHTIIPLHVKLEDIEKVEADDSGRVTLKVPLRHDIHIPLELSESRPLVEKLEELIPAAKAQALEKKRVAEKARQEVETKGAEYLAFLRKPA